RGAPDGERGEPAGHNHAARPRLGVRRAGHPRARGEHGRAGGDDAGRRPGHRGGARGGARRAARGDQPARIAMRLRGTSKRLVVALLLLGATASCAYYNTFYLARKYYFKATDGLP